ncbi:MAG: leucine-rich repeat domain-containing protein [Clostridia bacterium]|nr:leucine-rich repeat domain-containing protein [Clostridia bacterium]
MKHTAKKILCTLLVMVMCLTVAPLSGFVDFGITASALADSGSCGENVTYTYDSSTGELVISGTGAMTNYYSGSGSPFYNSDIKSVVIEDGVTSIGSFAFYNCTSLQSVIIPDSVTSIEAAFCQCTSLASVTIPDSVITIAAHAFSGCESLQSITIPDSVTSIGGYGTFEGCRSLESITIGNSVTYIGNLVFCGCSSLKSVTIPDSVTSIEADAFVDCTSLESVTIPDSVTSISFGAFSGCTSLTDVYYGGTEEQWNSIIIEVFRNECLTGATIHFLGEDLSPEEEVDNSFFGKIKAFFTRIIEWFRNLFR